MSTRSHQRSPPSAPAPGVRATPETFTGCLHWMRAPHAHVSTPSDQSPPCPRVHPGGRLRVSGACWLVSALCLSLCCWDAFAAGGEVLRSEGTFVWIEVVAPASPARPGPLGRPEVPSTQKALSSYLALHRGGHLC